MSLFSQDDFAQETGASPEIIEDYAKWGALLTRWNKKINLVAPSTLSDYWHRHALDSWQVTPLLPKSTEGLKCLDLGSGAGFPGLAIAIEMKARGTGHVWLVESAGKKANFLRTVIRECGLPASVINDRVESLELEAFDVISARAFAPLPRLFTYAHPFWKSDTLGIFLKGQALASEQANADKEWEFNATTRPSVTDPTGFILEVTSLASRGNLNGENTS